MTPDDSRHGTNAGYINGCRDECCRTAHADYKRGLRTKLYLARGPMLIDATGTRRRLEGLAAIGWTFEGVDRAINRARGFTSRVHRGIVLRDAKIHRDTAALFAAEFERLCMTVPTGRMATRQRNLSVKKGWLPPLTWNDLDDPNELPDTAGERRQYAAEEMAAEWDFLRRCGLSMEQAAERLGVHKTAIEKALARVAGRAA